MNKQLLFSIIIILIITITVFGIWIIIDNSISDNINFNNVENNATNTIEISTKHVNDNCVNEWIDYTDSINRNIASVSSNFSNEDSHYLVKNEEGFIHIYCLNEFNEETLYKKTNISTEYLSIEDLDKLEIGIEVVGSKNLNQLLEDFE